MAAPTPKSVSITNVRPFQSIPLNFPVEVAYTTGTTPVGIVSVLCPDAAVHPPQANVNQPAGTLTFDVAHALAGQGHTLSATLNQGGVVVAGCAITDVVIMPNPVNEGPLTLAGYDGFETGLPVVDTTANLKGTFKPGVGNKVILLVEKPVVINGVVHPSRLIFADPAEVTITEGPPPQGKWKHAAIPGVKPGQRLVIVLTKDGVVKALLQAVYK
jgi:hypothetical protein